MCGKYLGKGRDLYVAFMSLENAHDKILDVNAKWQVVQVYGAGEKVVRTIHTERHSL